MIAYAYKKDKIPSCDDVVTGYGICCLNDYAITWSTICRDVDC